MRDRSLLMLGLFAGRLRTGELNRLRWRDVDVDHGVMRVRRKGDHPATVVMTPQLQAQLRQWRDVMRLVDGFTIDWPVLPVFTAPHGDATSFALRQPVAPLTRELTGRVVNAHGAAIGLDYLRPHDLRRTLAGILDAHGTPLQDIQLVMRHETLSATQAYLSENPLRVRQRMVSFVIELGRNDDQSAG